MIFWLLVGIAAIAVIWFTVLFMMDEGLIGIFVGFLGAVLAGFLIFVTYIPAGFYFDKYSEHDYSSDWDLKALKMGDQTTGNFFLGSGVIEGENVYTFYYVNENGNYQSGRIDADRTEVVESDTETPHIVKHYWKMPWWWGPMDMENTWTVYVPVGSVVSTYEMSLP